jgi:predicted enzyme related to lactoylglutathione lyase
MGHFVNISSCENQIFSAQTFSYSKISDCETERWGNMAIDAKFVHTNIVAKDWQRLAAFYEDVLACVRVPPERHLQGQWIAKATGVSKVKIDGIHLRLPGYGDQGPTLEIFEYNQVQEGQNAINRPGFAHIAFAVEDVAAAREAVLAAGGKEVGQLTEVEIAGTGTIVFVYLSDPEGNVLEFQQWRR